MRNLIEFFIRYSAWFLFAFYAVVSCTLLFDRNPFHHHVFLSTAGKAATSVYELANNVTSYFGLRDINEDLQRQTAELQAEVVALRERIIRYEELYHGDTMNLIEPLRRFDFKIARVINNSVSRPHNYITIDKGTLDSIRPEMGVVDQNGVVGIVNIVSPHYARVISLLNPHLRLSCKVKGNDAFGSLVWDGKSPREAILEELPRHTVYNMGDTIITSGYSAVFPEGIPVGIVTGNEKTIDDNFFTLRVRLLTDFSRLSNVRVITNADIDEIREVEKDNIQNEPDR